ncbi:MAG: RT0821/Lpp0805 family surface protein [Mesorhizobium sp.]|nr:RT0821/Lpp0805 family surface protein [Mesorhizobium sp.]
MPGEVQDETVKTGARRVAAASVLAALVACAATVSGCAGGGFGLRKAEADPTILTGALPPASDGVADSQRISDQATVRNAISSANIEDLNGAPIAWANVDTGSRGTIYGVSERREGGVLCRRFTASRESFQGISLYRGEACAAGDGAWWMRSFDES